MKTIITALAVVMALGSTGAMAATLEIPNRFRGIWIDTENGSKMTVAADHLVFGSSSPVCRFTKVTVANEEGTAYEVNWHPDEDAAGVEIKMAFRLMKVWGKETLVSVNAEDPTSLSIYQRVR